MKRHIGLYIIIGLTGPDGIRLMVKTRWGDTEMYGRIPKTGQPTLLYFTA